MRERDELETWVRQGVMSADDRDALWAWVECPSGRDDLPAWKRLLTQLDLRGPRRSLAAARVRSLRAAFAIPRYAGITARPVGLLLREGLDMAHR